MSEVEKLSKATAFRKLLTSKDLEFICEVHNGISAKIVGEAGFKAGWASSLTISASYGVCDNNELSWSQILEDLGYICDATPIPILLDGDTGYGNFNNMRILVKNLEKNGVSAVCIEDKIFPKTNSFINGGKQALASIEEFSGKIKAAKDTQRDDDFSVIARIEAFIAGWGLGEALKRAEAYHKSGADAILIHSASSRPDEILSFRKEWGDRCPVVIVPTKYYTTPVEVFQEAGISAVIWANMTLRSAVHAMQKNIAELFKKKSILPIEDKMISVGEIFRLQGASELQKAEDRYLPPAAKTTQGIILAASRGKALGKLTQDKPKALLDVAGTPLLHHQIDILNKLGIKKITVVRGYKKEMFNLPGINFVDNDDYESTQEVFSLYKAIMDVEDEALVAYGDILYKKFIPDNLLESPDEFVLAVDAGWWTSQNKGRYADFMSCSEPYKKEIFNQNVTLMKAGTDLLASQINGEWIGLMKISAPGLTKLKSLLSKLSEKENFKSLRMSDLFNAMINKNFKITVQYIHGNWVDVDDLGDISNATSF